ncbi:MAG: hypothetical protein LBU43_06250 [Candidatus Accumulibacter sp.]|jgi:Tfp pilus assembly protein PilX|nr:hypothetical protein [Accumulibacter sp.]
MMTPRKIPVVSARQTGVVLVIALIVLIAMTLSALSLIRSVNMTNLISSNLAFRESAVLSSERGMEEALIWLGANNLNDDVPESHYWAKRVDPSPDNNCQTSDGDPDWGCFYDSLIPSGSGGVTDSADNRVTYIIHRLCEREGEPTNADCSIPPLAGTGNSKNVGDPPPVEDPKVYYRITSRVEGPRNTVVYTQTILVL